MHHASLANRVEWEMLTALVSDHFPIISTIGKKKPGKRKQVRFSYNKADWTLFERKTEDACGNLPPPPPPAAAAAAAAAANATMPRGQGGSPKAWWSEEVQEAVEERDRLRARARIDPAAGDEW